jgi:riboflavin kinase/FMN adenylyltransferase
MRLYRHESDLPPNAKGAVVTLGNFDGVHLGHQAVIRRAAAIAEANGLPLSLLTFEPHTRGFFNPDQPPFRLTPLRAKLHALGGFGIDSVIALTFNKALSELSPDDFVSSVLVRGLGAAHAVAGGNFLYGHRRGGTMATLAAAGERHGFGVTAVDAVCAPDGMVYSATAIRAFITAGDLRAAAALLGRPWEIDGHIISGDRRGRTLGFPTANMKLGEYLRPAYGIYAVRVQTERSRDWIDGVANLGIRPMWRTAEPVLESHLFDFSADLYGQVLRVQLIERLRGEAKFESVEQLVAQVELDKQAAREALAR